MVKTGKNLDDLQDGNRAQVVRYLAMHEGCSRVDLAKATGLKQASITKIMRSLMHSGVVSETGFTEGLKGRRSIGLALNYSRFLVIGVKLSWERLTIRVFDLQGKPYSEVIGFHYGHLDNSTAEAVVALVADTVRRLQKEFPAVIAVGLAVPGPFHRGEGSVYIPDKGQRIYYPFREKLSTVLKLPLVIDHDANAGALAYWWFRTNCDTRMALLYFLASEGIGGGIVAKGQIFTGQRGHSAEMGHMVVETGGRPCVCGGRGCLDAYASSFAVEKRAPELTKKYPGSILADRRAITIENVFAAMRKGDKLAIRLIKDVGNYMGIGFASLIPIFDPDLIVIGDLMACGGDVLRTSIEKTLSAHLSPFYKSPTIVLADPEDDLVLLGAATIAINHAFSRPTEFLMATA